jgi:DNA-binding beta-propeller fold protein YncE
MPGLPVSRAFPSRNPFSIAVDPSGTALYSNNDFANTLTRYELGNGYLVPTPIQSVSTGY